MVKHSILVLGTDGAASHANGIVIYTSDVLEGIGWELGTRREISTPHICLHYVLCVLIVYLLILYFMYLYVIYKCW